MINSDNFPADFRGSFEFSELELAYLLDWQGEIETIRAEIEAAAPYLYNPFKGSYPVTQGFHGGHPAYDWGMPNRTPLYAPAHGQVTFMGYSQYYAYNLRIVYPEWKLLSLYAHMPAKGTWADGLKVGAWVEPKQHVSYSNNTGNSTGPHLHMEMRKPPYAGYADCVNFFSWLHAWSSAPPPPPPGQYPYQARVIKAGGLNVYPKRSTLVKPVGKYPYGQVITVIADAPNDAVRDWVRVGTEQYVIAGTARKRYLQRVG